jgi:hypothetical protein
MKKSKTTVKPAPAVKKSALDVASEELDSLVKAQTTPAADAKEDPAEMLDKAVAKNGDLKKGDGPGDGDGPGGEVISGGKGGDKGEEETDDEDEYEDDDERDDEDDEAKEEDATKSAANPRGTVRGAFYDELLDHPTYGKVVEASPALEHMTTVMGKSFEFIAQQNAALRNIVKSQGAQILALAQAHTVTQRALSVFMKSQAPGSTSIAKSAPTPGVMGRSGNLFDEAKLDKSGAKGGELAKSEVTHRITRALTDGKLGPDGADILLAYDARGGSALSRIPDDVRKSYGIPDPPSAG